MAKGYECPICKTYTVQPVSTNKLKCSKCNSTFDRERIVRG